MFCDHRQFAHVRRQRDKMCFWSTAGTPNPLGQVSLYSRTLATFLLSFCYRFAIHLLSICYHRGLPVFRLLPFCYFFAIELLPLPNAIPSLRHVSDVYIAAPQGCPFRIPFITAC
ncbi:hypothetical protein DW520_27015 [Escherichia coli]|nr:hypothetical protein [Escherichia coli O179:H8]EFO1178330.1 hypothetical protein [Escherichia coli]